MKYKKQILVFAIFFISTFLISLISAVTYIDKCQVLDKQDETYILSDNIVQLEKNDCIIIKNTGITLDCNRNSRYSITSDESIRGVFSDKDRTTVKNCNINVGDYISSVGIYLYNQEDSIISNNVLNGQENGLILYETNDSIIENNNVSLNKYGGIFLIYSNNNKLKNNIASECYAVDSSGFAGCSGLRLYQSLYNNIDEIKVNSNKIGIYLDSGAKLNTFQNILADSNTKYGLYFSGSFRGNVNQNIVHNSIVVNSGISDVFSRENANNNYLINVKYDTDDVFYYSDHTRKWYYSAYVKDNNNNPIQNAIVKIIDKNNQIVYSLTTNNQGYTDVVDLTEYRLSHQTPESPIVKTNFYPYKITVTYNNQDYEKTHNIFNDNILNDEFTVQTTGLSNTTNNCNIADIDNNRRVWTEDFTIFKANFNKRDCSITNNYCNGADLDKDRKVWLSDFAIFRWEFGKYC